MQMIFSLKDVKVPKSYLTEIVEDLDADKDGYISIKEVISMMKAWKAEIKKASKFLKE